MSSHTFVILDDVPTTADRFSWRDQYEDEYELPDEIYESLYEKKLLPASGVFCYDFAFSHKDDLAARRVSDLYQWGIDLIPPEACGVLSGIFEEEMRAFNAAAAGDASGLTSGEEEVASHVITNPDYRPGHTYSGHVEYYERNGRERGGSMATLGYAQQAEAMGEFVKMFTHARDEGKFVIHYGI